MNPEIENIPNIGQVKRSIEYQNYIYNQEQLERKRQILKRQKQHEIQQTTFQNHQALVELQNEKYRSLRKKFQVQDTLQKQYEHQIDIQKRVKTQQKSKEKIYSFLQKELLQNQQKNRIYEMSKIYQIGSNQSRQTRNNFRQKHMLTQGCQDSLDYLRNQSVNDFKNDRQKVPSIRIEPQYSQKITMEPKQQEMPRLDTSRYQKNSLPYIQHQTTPLKSSNQKKYSMLNLDYADYLKREIDRRQKDKQTQKRKQLEKDKSWIEGQNQSYYQSVQQMKFFNQKKKHDLAIGLEKQLYWKKQYKGF